MIKIQKICIMLGTFILVGGSLLATSHIVRAEDSGSNGSGGSTPSGSGDTGGSSGSQTEAQKQAVELIQQQKEAAAEAAKKAAEQAYKIQEQLQEAEQHRQEAIQHEQESKTSTEKTEPQKQADAQRQDNFLKACQNRSQTLKSSLTGITSYTTKQTATLDTLDDRLEAYVLKQNLSVPNYDTLLAAVKTQRALADGLTATLEQKANGFTCTGDKAAVQAAIQTYKDTLQQKVTIISAYKTAVKNLIVAIKSVSATNAQEGKQ